MNSKLLIFDLDDTLFPRLPEGYSKEQLQRIQLFPNAREIITRTDLKKVLVSKGNPLEQYAKIKQLQIQDCFDLILIPSTDEEKKTCFEQAAEKFPSEFTFVIGDRIDTEIQFGNELGLVTVLLKQGKYKDLVPKHSLQIPQYVITSLQELVGIIS